MAKLTVIEMALLKSSAFRTLNGSAIQVLLDFLMRRKMQKSPNPRSHKRGDKYYIANNGRIVYTYTEAECNGISRSAFASALDKLIEHGFIDIAQTGAGQFKSASFYSISDRWKEWGTSAFVPKSRPKKTRYHRGIGFQPGHPYHPQKPKN